MTATRPTFYHPVRIEAAVLADPKFNQKLLRALPESASNVRVLDVDAGVFTQAYLLLAQDPQRFTNNLALFLSTVRTFFEMTGSHPGGLQMPKDAYTDARRRLSEDLGVGLSAYFMTTAFSVQWQSISQLPVNAKLGKKRPDFQSYNAANDRYLFEAKGTTDAKKVESTLAKAKTQVKDYRLDASSKLAIVSFLCVDDRLFPSFTFVVDPPLPAGPWAEPETSRLLHFEYVLRYSGLETTAAKYLEALPKHLKAPESYEARQLQREVQTAFAAERRRLTERTVLGVPCLGRQATVTGKQDALFAGASVPVLEAMVTFRPYPESFPEPVSTREDHEYVTALDDGTVLALRLVSDAR